MVSARISEDVSKSNGNRELKLLILSSGCPALVDKSRVVPNYSSDGLGSAPRKLPTGKCQHTVRIGGVTQIWCPLGGTHSDRAADLERCRSGHYPVQSGELYIQGNVAI